MNFMATLLNDRELKSLFGTLGKSLSQIQERQSDIPDIIKSILREEAGSIQNRWLIGAGSLIIGLGGLFLTVTASPVLQNLLREYGVLVGVICMIASAGILAFIGRQK